MLSTIHTTSMISSRKIYSITTEQPMKPICVADYNKNSRAVYKSIMQLLDFCLQIIRDIVQNYGSQQTATRGRPSSTITSLRLNERHSILPILATDTQAAPRRKCVVFSNTMRCLRKRDVLARYECSDCDGSLCLIDCFTDFHAL